MKGLGGMVVQDARGNLVGTAKESTGVYVGCVWQEYQVLLEHLRVTPSVAVLTGSGMNFMIGRVSYTFGLQGAASCSGPLWLGLLDYAVTRFWCKNCTVKLRLTA